MIARRPVVKIAVAATAIAIMAGAATLTPASASRPVPRTIVGCVVDGAFISSDGYHIRPRYKDRSKVDLHALEGQRVILDGNLLPGDIMYLKTPPRALGPCKPAH